MSAVLFNSTSLMTTDHNNVESMTTSDYSNYYDGNETFPTPCDTVDLKDFGKVFLPTLYSLVFILGFTGNGLVVCVLVEHRNQKNLTDMCLFNLAVSDLLFVLTLPFYAFFTAHGSWTLGEFMCRFVSLFHYTGFFSSIFFMIVMTLDRYVIIMHAHTVAKYRTWSTAVAVTLLVWLLSFCISLPPFLFSKVTNETDVLTCSYDHEVEVKHPYMTFAIIVLGLLFPLLVLVMCYCKIIPKLVNMRTSKKHRVVRLIVSIIVVFFLFWAPYNVCILMKYLQPQAQQMQCDADKSFRVALTVTETFAYTHCCLNPIIYAFVGQKFMNRAAQLLRKWIPGVPILSPKDMSDSSYRKSSMVSRSSEVTNTAAM